ncbi:MAG: hypothetical protein DRI79_12215 [Chloroflexi bacterium]|nr:MAG: hypothetical protein DRI79_12215 [Chloroflexota bacterium]
MYPIIHLGPLDIGTHGVVDLIGGVVVFIIAIYRVRRGRWPVSTHDVLNIAPYMFLGAMLGAWLVSLLPRVVAYAMGASFPPMWWLKGRDWAGMMVGGSLVGYVYCRRRNLALSRCFDLVAPLVPLYIAIYRVGCLLTGCCYGKETTSWPSLFLPDIHGVWAYRYPTRIADIIANLIILALLLAFERYRAHREEEDWPFSGFLFLLYLGLYSVQRFYFEFWRAETYKLVGPFTWAHLYCAIGIGLATWGILHGWMRGRNKKRGTKCLERSNI